MKRPSSYISVLLRFTERNQENAYQPVSNNLKMKEEGGEKVGESAFTAHGAATKFVSAPEGTEAETHAFCAAEFPGAVQASHSSRTGYLGSLTKLVPCSTSLHSRHGTSAIMKGYNVGSKKDAFIVVSELQQFCMSVLWGRRFYNWKDFYS